MSVCIAHQLRTELLHLRIFLALQEENGWQWSNKPCTCRFASLNLNFKFISCLSRILANISSYFSHWMLSSEIISTTQLANWFSIGCLKQIDRSQNIELITWLKCRYIIHLKLTMLWEISFQIKTMNYSTKLWIILQNKISGFWLHPIVTSGAFRR